MFMYVSRTGLDFFRLISEKYFLKVKVSTIWIMMYVIIFAGTICNMHFWKIYISHADIRHFGYGLDR